MRWVLLLSVPQTWFDLRKLGLAYDMPSFEVDGMSPEAVSEAIAEAAERGRKGDGPTLLDIKTYRYKGHSMSDPQKYRTKEEVESYKDQDPIQKVLKVITSKKWATEDEIKAIGDKVKQQVADAVKFAEESPEPVPADLYEDVYQEADYPYLKDY